MRRLLVCIGMLVLAGCAHRAASNGQIPRTTPNQGGPFARLDDSALDAQFQRLQELAQSHPRRFDEDADRELILTEMVHRGGERSSTLLAQQLEAAAQQPLPDDLVVRLSMPPRPNLQTLTALRRLQNKPDPLAIQIAQAGPLRIAFPDLPVLDVAAINQDVDKSAVGFKFGGDYRSGRPARWRIEITEKNGRQVPILPSDSMIGGGIYHYGTLAFGETWKTTLEGSRFLPALVPGDYSLHVLYHNEICIADLGRI